MPPPPPQTVTVLVDSCVGVPECQAAAAVSGSSRFLNVAAPLQLGGSAVPLSQIQALLSWDRLPGWGGFTGCIQNMTFLDRVRRRKWRGTAASMSQVRRQTVTLSYTFT